jgi:hypothetical protein
MKITTLIPAFKPQYLQQLLIGLESQTVRPARIIISDDSPTQAFRGALIDGPFKQTAQKLNIEVLEGPRQGVAANGMQLMRAWNTETPLLHILMDDDVIYPDFYERHLAVHATGQFDCSVSRRWTALESGQPVGSLPMPDEVKQHGDRLVALEPDYLFTTTVPASNNWLGEHSNTIFSRRAIEACGTGEIAGIPFSGLEDIGMFLASSLVTPVCFINEPLGFFRMNTAQTSQQPNSKSFKRGVLAWAALGLAGVRVGMLRPEHALQCFGGVLRQLEARYSDASDMQVFIMLMRELSSGNAAAADTFVQTWHDFIAAP